MHTYVDEESQTVFIYNSDFSGEVKIRDRETGNEMEVNGFAILRFVAYNYVMSKLVSKIEQMDWKELLSKAF